MLIFCENGRLGNQIFQYSGLRKIYPNELIFFFGFKSFFECFDAPNCIQIPLHNKFLRKFITKIVHAVLSFISSHFRIISLVQETHINNESKITITHGLISHIKYCKNIHFESEKYLPNNIRSFLEFKIHHSKDVAKTLVNNSNLKNNFFIHIRRGDYLKPHWHNGKEFLPALPLEWYKKCISLINTKLTYKPSFLVFTDDLVYATTILDSLNSSINSFAIVHEDEISDFMLMTQCSGGILSASSFSWWAAFFAGGANPYEKIFLAPLFWRGHQINEWSSTCDVKTSWLEYVKVDHKLLSDTTI
jgi:hypothetical protein